jgi:phosphatidylglycerophosphatase A
MEKIMLNYSRSIVIFMASGAYTGFSPVVSGTVGSLLGIPLGLLFLSLDPWSFGVVTVTLILLSWWLSHKAQEYLGVEDPKEVVIDEILGQALAIYFIPYSIINLFLIFLLFRFFDILKPFPIRNLEKRFRGGGGIVLDDLLAAVYAVIAFRVIRNFI